MEFFCTLRDKVRWKKQCNDDPNDSGYQTFCLSQQPHLELFNDIKNERRSGYGYSSIAKLWRVDEKGREALFSCYLRNANCVVVITQNEMDKMAMTYQYQHRLASTSYELYFYTGKSFLDWHLEQFKRPKPFTLESSHIIHVTVLQKQSMIVVFGFNSSGQLTLYCYCMKYDYPFSFHSFSETADLSEQPLIINNVDPGELSVSLHNVKPYIIKENQFSKLTTRVAGETQENDRLAIVFSDFSDRPRPNLLFIWQMFPKIALLQYVDLRTVYTSIRGVVCGLCFWNGMDNLIFATTMSQLFHMSLVNEDFSKKDLNLKKKQIFLEKEEENIKIIKLFPRYQRDIKMALYGIGDCGHLYLIPDLDDWHTHPVKVVSLTDQLPVSECKIFSHQVSDYSKQLFLLGQNKYLYIYDLGHQQFTNAVRLPNDKHEIDENWSMKLSINWFGTEVYFVCYDHLYVIECPVTDTNLKQMARTTVLKNYSEEVLISLSLPKPILGFLLNKYAF